MNQQEYEANIISKALEADKLKDCDKIVNYVVKLEIDIDCEELLDAIGLPYERSLDDETQNVVTMRLEPDEYKEYITDNIVFEQCNEQHISNALLNAELSEYTTKATIYKPNGDVISFY
tara:strand:+ start:321 stop:677 length:357 start_codon:yes stop_codon:yes gene_type:complete